MDSSHFKFMTINFNLALSTTWAYMPFVNSFSFKWPNYASPLFVIPTFFSCPHYHLLALLFIYYENRDNHKWIRSCVSIRSCLHSINVFVSVLHTLPKAYFPFYGKALSIFTIWKPLPATQINPSSNLYISIPSTFPILPN